MGTVCLSSCVMLLHLELILELFEPLMQVVLLLK